MNDPIRSIATALQPAARTTKSSDENALLPPSPTGATDWSSKSGSRANPQATSFRTKSETAWFENLVEINENDRPHPPAKPVIISLYLENS